MNRRGFLKLFGLTAPLAAVAPTYFFAPIGGWKSDVLLNPADLYNDLTASVLDSMSAYDIYNNFFISTPFQQKLRQRGALVPFDGGTSIREPFIW